MPPFTTFGTGKGRGEFYGIIDFSECPVSLEIALDDRLYNFPIMLANSSLLAYAGESNVLFRLRINNSLDFFQKHVNFNSSKSTY